MDKTRIIVVEDNIVYCEYVCNMLSREGDVYKRQALPMGKARSEMSDMW